MATRKRKKQRTPEPESELLRRARESTTGQPLISQFISIRPNGTSFPSKIVPFKPLVGNGDASRWNVPKDAPNTSNFRQILSQSNAASSSSNMLPMPSTVSCVTQPFKPVFAISSSQREEKQESMVAMNKVKQEEGNAAIPTLEDDENDDENDDHFPSMEIQCVQCEMSDLQKDLYGAIDYLMSLNEQEQHNLKVQLFNHPCLLFVRVQQLSAPFANNATGKKARAQWVSYSNVLSQFPTRYESLRQCHIEESGKLLKLFQILVESARDDDAQNPARLIVASSFPRTLNLIADLMDQVNAKLNYSIYSFTPNMPSTTRHWDLGRAMGDVGRKLILLNTKTENLPNDFFTGAHLIFFDFDKTNDGKLLARWNVAGVELVQRLATAGTFETK